MTPCRYLMDTNTHCSEADRPVYTNGVFRNVLVVVVLVRKILDFGLLSFVMAEKITSSLYGTKLSEVDSSRFRRLIERPKSL